MNARDVSSRFAVMADTSHGRMQIGSVHYSETWNDAGFRFFPVNVDHIPSRKRHPTPEAAIAGRVKKSAKATLEPLDK